MSPLLAVGAHELPIETITIPTRANTGLEEYTWPCLLSIWPEVAYDPKGGNP